MERRPHFGEELDALKHRLLNMGALVEDRVHRAVHALIACDVAEAEAVAAGDQEVNDFQIEIDDRCIKLLALQQPMARDLRFITSAIKINADLERIADQAVNIAESAGKVLAQGPALPSVILRRMAELAERMTRDSLDAFVNGDVALARDVILRDDEVDRLKDRLFGDLIAAMMADPASTPDALSFVLIGRNLERIADHATNIAEDVIFMVEAKDVRHHHRT
jgi:phosphate transport system protein